MWVGKPSVLVLKQIDFVCFLRDRQYMLEKYRWTYIKSSFNAALKIAPPETNNDGMFHKNMSK